MSDESLEREFDESLIRHAHLPKTKINYMTLRKLRKLKADAVGDAGWAKFFEHLTKNVNLSPTMHERVQVGTMTTLMKKWMQNLADNLPYIRYGPEVTFKIPENYQSHTIAELAAPEPVSEKPMTGNFPAGTAFISGVSEVNELNLISNGSAVVVGRGPSLFENEHCALLRESKYQGAVVASDGGLIPLLEEGVVPDIVVTVDGAEKIKKYFDHPQVRKYGHKMKWITTVTVSPEVYKIAQEAGIKTYWFNPMFDDVREIESVTRLEKLLTSTEKNEHGAPRVQSGGNSGACAWVIAGMLLKRAPVALMGIDFGYPDGTKLEKTQYYDRVYKESKGDAALIKKAYPEFYHPTFKKKAFVDLVFYHYRQAFLDLQEFMPYWYRLLGGTINCTEGGTLFGPGITCMPFKDFLSKYPR